MSIGDTIELPQNHSALKLTVTNKEEAEELYLESNLGREFDIFIDGQKISESSRVYNPFTLTRVSIKTLQ